MNIITRPKDRSCSRSHVVIILFVQIHPKYILFPTDISNKMILYIPAKRG